MKLVDLIRSSSWLSVEIVFLQCYPDEEVNLLGYSTVFFDLTNLEPIDTDIVILIRQVIDDFDNEAYVDVSGYYKDTSKAIDDLTDSLALEFTPWEEWLGMDIDKQSLLDFTALELICHCLYEMSFFGFEQQEIQNKFDSINDSVDEIKNVPVDEKNKKLFTLREVIEQIEKKDIHTSGRPES